MIEMAGSIEQFALSRQTADVAESLRGDFPPAASQLALTGNMLLDGTALRTCELRLTRS
jgi:hypothetical protein